MEESKRHNVQATARNQAMDIAKGIVIICMVLGHCALLWDIHPFFNSFHMPFFFIVSGYFFREAALGTLLRKSVKRLVVPMVFTTLVSALVCWGFFNWGSFLIRMKGLIYPDGTTDYDVFAANMPCIGAAWFLAALFWCRLIFLGIHRWFSDRWLLVSIILAFIAAYVGARFLNLPLGILNGLVGMGFYAVGARARERGWDKQELSPVCWIAFVMVWLYFVGHFQHGMFGFQYTIFYPISFAIACLASLFVLKLSQQLEKSERVGKVLNFIGQNTLTILCCHEVARVAKDGLLYWHGKYVTNENDFFILVTMTFVFALIWLEFRKRSAGWFSINK